LEHGAAAFVRVKPEVRRVEPMAHRAVDTGEGASWGQEMPEVGRIGMGHAEGEQKGRNSQLSLQGCGGVSRDLGDAENQNSCRDNSYIRNSLTLSAQDLEILVEKDC
jgi:hypothetical protein